MTLQEPLRLPVHEHRFARESFTPLRDLRHDALARSVYGAVVSRHAITGGQRRREVDHGLLRRQISESLSRVTQTEQDKLGQRFVPV